MNKIFFALLIVLCSGSLLFAQGGGFFLRAGMGYGFPQAGQTMDNTGFPLNGSMTNAGNGDVVYNLKSTSFSSGMQGEIGMGYMFNKYIGLELDMAIGLANTKYTGSQNNVMFDSVTQGNINVTQYAQTPILLMPCFVLQNGGLRYNIYARAGLVLPVSTKIKQEQGITYNPGTSVQEIDIYSSELKNSFSLGFTGAVGVQYNLTGNTSIWGEVDLLSMSLYASEDDLTEITVTQYGMTTAYPASSVPPNQPVAIKYGKNVTIPAGTNGTPQPSYALPFSNVGVHFGVTMKFAHHNYNKGRDTTPRHYSRGRG